MRFFRIFFSKRMKGRKSYSFLGGTIGLSRKSMKALKYFPNIFGMWSKNITTIFNPGVNEKTILKTIIP